MNPVVCSVGGKLEGSVPQYAVQCAAGAGVVLAAFWFQLFWLRWLMLYCCLRYLKCSVTFATGLKFTALLGMLASAGD